MKCPICQKDLSLHTDAECLEELAHMAMPFVRGAVRQIPNAKNTDVDVLVRVSYRQWETLKFFLEGAEPCTPQVIIYTMID